MKKFTGGFGTSLCWFANINYPEDIKKNIHNLLFTKEGLGLNIVRYNLGGGKDVSKKQNMRAGGDMPCISDSDGDIILFNDHYQLAFLDKAVKQGTVNKVELFSNSPPYWMTKSGLTNGSTKMFDCNLNPENITDFAVFLVDCYNRLREDYPVVSISPFNEPSNPFWMTDVAQEGCFWDYSTRNKVLQEMRNIAPDMYIAACDEFSPLFQIFWSIFGKHHLYDRVNVHGYRLTRGETTFYFDDFNFMRRLIRKFTKKDLWMSEFGWGYKDNVKDSINLARNIFRDLDTYKPEAWCFWQVIENYGNDWGLIQTDFANPKELVIRKMYYIFKHFTKTLLENDSYVVINKNILYIENDKHHKFIILNDSSETKTFNYIKDSKINVQETVKPFNIVMTDTLEVYKEIESFDGVFPKYSLTSIFINKDS